MERRIANERIKNTDRVHYLLQLVHFIILEYYIMGNFIAFSSRGTMWFFLLCLLLRALATLVITLSTWACTLLSSAGYLLKIPTYGSPLLPSLSLSLCMAYEHFAHEVQLRRRCNFFYVRVAAAIAASPARSFALILSQVCMSVPWCVCVCDDAAPPPLSCVCVENCVPPRSAHLKSASLPWMRQHSCAVHRA